KHAKNLLDVEFSMFQKTNEVITVDTRIKDYIQRESGVTATMIKNFINVEDFKPELERRNEFRKKFGFSEDDLIFFIPRRLTKKNGVIYPILSFPPVLKEYPNARLVFAGTGEMMDEMKAKAKELGIADRVT